MMLFLLKYVWMRRYDTMSEFEKKRDDHQIELPSRCHRVWTVLLTSPSLFPVDRVSAVGVMLLDLWLFQSNLSFSMNIHLLLNVNVTVLLGI